MRVFEHEQPIAAFFLGAVARLTLQHGKHGLLERNRLPHHVAVCVTKLDDAEVLKAAMQHGWISNDGPRGLPHVPDDRLHDYSRWLCQQSRDTSVAEMLATYFHPERIKYFATSAIGPYIKEPGVFDPDDFTNVLSAGGDQRVRGRLHPVNVIEPIVWLERQVRSTSTKR